jgi:predicted nucleotide-binding protein (sugar kinase/HSP70/actin superfamily)
MTETDIGRILNWSRVMILPVASDSSQTDPVLLPVGSRAMQSSVRAFILLSVYGTVLRTKSPNAQRKSRFASAFSLKKSSRGLAPQSLVLLGS